MKKFLLVLICASSIQAQSGITPETLKPADGILISKQTELQKDTQVKSEYPRDITATEAAVVGVICTAGAVDAIAKIAVFTGKVVTWYFTGIPPIY